MNKKLEKINFIPGLGEKPRDYKSLAKYFNIVDIDWNNGKTNIGKVDTLVGFSLGAVVACMHTEKISVKKLILCSLTPIENLDSVNAEEIIFMVGSKERFCLKNIRRVYKNIKCKKSIIIIEGGDHKISGDYRKKLLEITK